MHSSGSSLSSASASLAQREHFTAEELVVVLSHYDIGHVQSIAEFPRGSRRAPKMLLTSEQGRFLLKRRAPGRDDPFKVALTHALQIHLAARQFPMPALIGTKRDNNSMLQLHGHVYELFEYITGNHWPANPDASRDAGRVLALFHQETGTFTSQYEPSTGSYHAMSYIEQALEQLTAAPLLDCYRVAATRAQEAGLSHWPKQMVHADWHPGNMLFRDDRVVAVIDYDSARLLPRVMDVANGAMQFSLINAEANLDQTHYRSFLSGYDSVMLLSKAEYRALPWLMIEAMIAEAALSLAHHQPALATDARALDLVQQKVDWLKGNAELLGVAA